MRPARAPFLVVTGCHGVGKSTVAEALQAWLGAAVLPFPTEFVRFRERVGLDTGLGPVPQFLYYLGAVFQLSDQVRDARATRPVVCDRYLESPRALMRASGALTEAYVEQACAPFLPHLCVPDLTLFLTTTHETARQRILARGETLSSTQRRMVDSPDFYYACETALRTEAARQSRMRELDTTALSIEAMCASAQALAAAVVDERAER